jgi:hypothetical protein
MLERLLKGGDEMTNKRGTNVSTGIDLLKVLDLCGHTTFGEKAF